MGMIRMMMSLTLAGLLAACASGGGSRNDKLQQLQYDYSAAIRWGGFEGAWNVVDPEYRKAHPISDLELARYQQIQVSGYRELGSQVSADRQQAMREIQIDVINRHTMTERSIRYTEVWRYDPVAKTWWLTSGLSDFWAGQ